MNIILLFFMGWGIFAITYVVGEAIASVFVRLLALSSGKQLKKITIDGVEFLTDITESELYYLDGTEVPDEVI